jgi:hypothetical protein
VWGDLNEQGARDGTPVFIYGFATQTIRTTDGSPFSLEQLDIGLSFFTNPSENVTVTLNFAGGGSSSFNLSLTQNFQTLILNASNLSSIQISSPNTSLGYVALDNIVFNEPANLPEPSTLALFGMAAATFAGYCGWRRRKQPVSA